MPNRTLDRLAQAEHDLAHAEKSRDLGDEVQAQGVSTMVYYPIPQDTSHHSPSTSNLGLAGPDGFGDKSPQYADQQP